MKKFTLTILLAIFLNACSDSRVDSSAYSVILNTLLSHSAEEVSILQTDEKENVIYIDARSNLEFDVSHIKDAKFIGYDTLNFKTLESLQKDEEIIIYCSVGYRSEIVCHKLSELGFTNVSNLYGGLFEWINQSKPIVDGEGNITDRVHAFDKTWGIWLNKGEKVY